MPSIKTKATLDRSEYDKGLDAMKGAAKDLNSSMQGLGGLGGVIAGVFGGNMLTNFASKLKDIYMQAHERFVELGHDSENIGIDPEKLERIQTTFEHFGQSGEVIVNMFGRMAQARDKFLAGNQKMVADFAALGLANKQAVAGMSNEELFSRIAGAYAGGTGAGRSAASDILGRGLRSPGASRALASYGAGNTYGAAFEPSNTEVVKAQMVDAGMKILGKSSSNFVHSDWFFTGVYTPLVRSLTKPLIGGAIAAEMAARKAEQDKLAKDNADALAHTAETQAIQKAMGEAELERYGKDIEGERKRELEEGLHIQRPESDSYGRRGLMAGGGAVNTMAYQQGRQQVQLAQQLLESSRRIEAHLAIRARHTEALKNIATMGGGEASDFETEVE